MSLLFFFFLLASFFKALQNKTATGDIPIEMAAEFTDSFARHHEDQGVMTLIFACLLIYAVLSFVTSVTDVFVEDVSLLHVSSSLCGGRTDKNLLK